MTQVCKECGIEYDDVDHYTNCPHEYFKARYEVLGKSIFDTLEGRFTT